MLEIAPTCLPDTDASGAPAPLYGAIGEDREHGHTVRDVLPGDRRPLHGTICTLPATATDVGRSLPRGRIP